MYIFRNRFVPSARFWGVWFMPGTAFQVRRSNDTESGQSSRQQVSNNIDPRQIVHEAHIAPHLLTPQHVMTLQRSIGNRATSALLQPVVQRELTLGSAQDTQEIKAMRVADQIARPVQPRPSLQRSEEIEENIAPTLSPVQRAPLPRHFVKPHAVQRQPKDDEERVEAQSVSLSQTPVPTVQRLVTREQFVRLAGDVSKKGKVNKSLYTQILNELEAYQKTSVPEERKKILMNLAGLTRSWIYEHTKLENKGTQKDEPVRVAKKEKDLRKEMFMEPLRDEVLAELGGKELPEFSPSKAIAAYKASGEQADTYNEQLKGLDKSKKFRFSLLASVDHVDYFEFSRKRLELTIQNKKTLLSKNKKSGIQIKEEAAKSVVEEKYKELTDEERLAKIKELQGISGQVGHAWVRLAILDQGKVQDEKSFGFWPLAFFPHPEKSVPGRVRHPDTVHDSDSNIRQIDKEIPAEDYEKAMSKVTERMKSTPDYKLIDYNCTAFTKEVADAAKVPFPKSAYMRIPFRGLTWDPNALFRELDKDPEKIDPAAQRQEQKQQQAKKQNRIEEIHEALYEVDLTLYYERQPAKMTVNGSELYGEIKGVEIKKLDTDWYSLIYSQGEYQIKASDYENVPMGKTESPKELIEELQALQNG
jgi:hypothetical protein